MNRFLVVRLTALFFCFQFFNVKAQKADLKLDTNAILIGDQINIEISYTIPAQAEVFMPVFKDTLTAVIEVIDAGAVDTIVSDDYMTLSRKIRITSFDTGYHVIKPIPLKYFKKGETTAYILETPPALLEVKGIEFDAASDIKDIKDIFNVPLTFREILPYLIAVLLLAGLLTLLFYYLKKRKKKEPLFSMQKPQVPPHVEALNALKALKNKKLWQNNQIKQYYTELTDIIRIYIEKTVNVQAMEMTSTEIIEAIEKSGKHDYISDALKHIFSTSDLVKFAKYKPEVTEHDNCYKMAVDYIQKTMAAKMAAEEAALKAEEKQYDPQDNRQHDADALQNKTSTDLETDDNK